MANFYIYRWINKKDTHTIYIERVNLEKSGLYLLEVSVWQCK